MPPAGLLNSVELMKAENSTNGVPNALEIRDALNHIAISPAFRQSAQLVSFLRFVVEMTIAGRGNAIKGYSIGVGALGRKEDFDPQVDPIVRVEAIRLRRALSNYFAHDGAGRPIVIEIPLGHYVPIFFYRKHRYLAAKLVHLAGQKYTNLIDRWTRPRQYRQVARGRQETRSNASL